MTLYDEYWNTGIVSIQIVEVYLNLQAMLLD